MEFRVQGFRVLGFRALGLQGLVFGVYGFGVYRDKVAKRVTVWIAIWDFMGEEGAQFGVSGAVFGLEREQRVLRVI